MNVKHVVGFSGGAASAVCAKIVADQHFDSTVLLFHDTKTEPSDNERFRSSVAEFIGLPITEDSDGRNIWELFRDEGHLGNGRNACCSRVLKQQRSMAYMKKHTGAILYIGFTVDESHRCQRTFARYNSCGVEVRFPLVELKICKDEVLHRVERCWGLIKPKRYDFLDHANCIPCIKGKKAYWGLMHMFERDAWETASAAEDEFGCTIFTDYGSLRDELDGCLLLAKRYLRKREYNNAQGSLFEYPCECSV